MRSRGGRPPVPAAPLWGMGITMLVHAEGTSSITLNAWAAGKTVKEYLNDERKRRERMRRAVANELAVKQLKLIAREEKANVKKAIEQEKNDRKQAYLAAMRQLAKRQAFRESWINMVRLAKIEHQSKLWAERQTQINETSFRNWTPILRRPPGMGKIIAQQVSEKYGVSITDIMAKGRSREVIQPRFELCYRLAKEAGYGLKEMGRFMNKDHTTCLHGRDTYMRWQRVKAGKEQPKLYDKRIDWDKII